VPDQHDFAGKIRHLGDDLVDHCVERDFLEGRSIFALTRQVYGLRAVTALFQFGNCFAPTPGTVKRPMDQ
jgi:hypothetical protein